MTKEFKNRAETVKNAINNCLGNPNDKMARENLMDLVRNLVEWDAIEYCLELDKDDQ